MQVFNKAAVSAQVQERLLLLWERTGDESLRRLAVGKSPRGEDRVDAQAEGSEILELTDVERADWLSTCLMDCYRNTGDAQVFAMLHDLNEASFRQAVQYKVRRSASSVDPHDVVQEVFLNIYRYPHRFVAEKADSFRNWGHRIVRNTLLKFLKGETRRSRFTTLEEDLGQRADVTMRTPYRSASEAETAVHADRAYLVYLNLYLIHFQRLSDKERRALTMVEVEDRSYKDAATELGIRLENLKMVIFRGRRKVLRGMNRSLARLSAGQVRSGDLMPSRLEHGGMNASGAKATADVDLGVATTRQGCFPDPSGEAE